MMQLLVIRHAVAEEREEFAKTGEPDEQRPLTPGGSRKMRIAARGLPRLVQEVDILATSPLVRAADTAAIVAEVYGKLTPELLEALRPRARPQTFLRWLRGQPATCTVAIVGHEPHLGRLVSWLLASGEGSFVQLKKGGACLLELPERPRAGAATLKWLLTPWQLRQLAE